MLTTDIVKHQGASHSGGTCAGGGMRCGPRSVFVWYTAADAAGNADGVKPTTRPQTYDSIPKQIGTALLELGTHCWRVFVAGRTAAESIDTPEGKRGGAMGYGSKEWVVCGWCVGGVWVVCG